MAQILWILVLGSQSVWCAGDENAGNQKSTTCMACHGDIGISNNELWPNLSGQKKQYMIKQLKDFRDGSRSHPLMSPVSKMLTEQDIEDVASYFSKRTEK